MRNATIKREPCPAKQVLLDAEKYESKIGLEYAEHSERHIGYLANIKPTNLTDKNGGEVAAFLLYFIKEDGKWIKAIQQYDPYFYVQCQEEVINEIVFYLNKSFEDFLKSVQIIQKEDLELVNHLSGKKGKFIKLTFKNIRGLQDVKTKLLPIIEKNKKNREMNEAYEGWTDLNNQAFLNKIEAIREYDVAYHVRAMIDLEIRCSFWYEVEFEGQMLTSLKQLPDKLDKADLRVFAFDIETTKAELKFPDSKFDQIMMISYVVDGLGYLITNRQVVSADVHDFEYAPKPEYDVGKITVFNEPNEKALLLKFFQHIKEIKPFIFVTFNGDFFDWPFIQDRAEHYQLRIEEEIGIYSAAQGHMVGRFTPHLDCLYWVKRDAYLPQGSHGLKMVTKAKLGYDPVELDPELMLPYAQSKPQELAEYSVSDSVATFFLYQKMIHDFIFALCTIIPTFPDEVLRKGSGTLCENLLMAQAFRGNIIFPNKQTEPFERFHEGKLIDQDTYTGGTVECLQQGVYRSDIPVKFRLQKAGFQELINKTQDIMNFAIQIESGANLDDVENYYEVKEEIISKLEKLRDQCPIVVCEPLIYHVDVAAMYPNIILSNRLQPVAIVNERICAGCIFNKPQNRCKRSLQWQWKGEMFPLSKHEFEFVKSQLEGELENNKIQNGYVKRNNQFDQKNETFEEKLKARVKKYCQRTYKQIHVKRQELRTDTVCMRENSFYVDTVRDFRDRRYEFKRLTKTWTGKLKDAQKENDIQKLETAKNRMNLYESLQLAHKIILNSFYGYVMKKGARWYSMEMAAMVTHTGGSIITDSRTLFDQIGMPLELDTDGIWTLLPKGFPESFSLKLKGGKKVNLEFPCTMCNNLIYKKYGNDQYQTLVKDQETGRMTYETREEMSVFFEIDGPYRCMLIPSSTTEGKMLKKRYAVFNHAGKMTEVKGFELKRRGELKIIKIFQEEVFSKFLEGKTLQEMYDACGEVGERWFDILDSQGSYVDEHELIEYIGEERVLSKGLNEYGDQKSNSITCARRLAQFLGEEILRDDGGINVKFIIARLPRDAPTAERAIPTSIFAEKQQIKEKYLKKWLKDNSLTNFDLKSILDWDYYKERLGNSIQKIVTIPAFLQKCQNPIPKIEYPGWLLKKKHVLEDKFKQKQLASYFSISSTKQNLADMEDISKSIIQAKSIQAQNTISKVQEPVYDMKDCPSPEDDFKEWMKYQKQNWRQIRKRFGDKKKEGNIVRQAPLISTNPLMENFLKKPDEVLLNSAWQIVSIEPPSAGTDVLKMWIFTYPIEGQTSAMFQINLEIPHIVYFNTKKETQLTETFKKINNKILPRQNPIYNLYEWKATENQLMNDKIQNLAMEKEFHGIYETKVPPQFRALLELGCIVKPIKNSIPIGIQATSYTYKLSQLDTQHSLTQKLGNTIYQEQVQTKGFYQNFKQNKKQQYQYLPQGSFIEFDIFQRKVGALNIFSLHLNEKKTIYMYIADPKAQGAQTKKNGEDNKEYLSLVKNILQSKFSGFEENIIEDWKIEQVLVFSEITYALQQLDKFLIQERTHEKRASLCVLQSQLPREVLEIKGLKKALIQMPVLQYPFNDQDKVQGGVEWLKTVTINILENFVELKTNWFNKQIDLARYGLTPIVNLCNTDSNLFVIDLLYSRQLVQNGHLLWYSDTGNPDLGGHEDKDFRNYYNEQIENPEWIKPGFYRGYSVEISIKNLLIESIIQSDFFSDLIQTQKQQNHVQNKNKNKDQNDIKMEENDKKNDQEFDEFNICSIQFNRLKELVKLWGEHANKQDLNAGGLLLHLQRWFASPRNAKLYDPLMQSLMHKLEKKSLMLMIRHLKTLGCKVVYASFTKFIIYTDKKSYDDAKSHLNFVMQTLKQVPIFRQLIYEVGDFWRILLFKDIFNYAGFKREENISRDDVLQPKKEKIVIASWDIMQHLPQKIQSIYSRILITFILRVTKYNQKLWKELKNQQQNQIFEQLPENNQISKVESLLDQVDDIKKEPDHDYVADLITNEFSQMLFKEVSDIMSYKAMENNPDNEFEEQESEDQDEEHDENGVYADQYEFYEEEQDDGFYSNKKGNNLVESRLRRQKQAAEKKKRQWEFPQRIGTHHNYINAALEFSKLITTHVFGLDEAFNIETQKMRSNLLRLLRFKEFSKEAQQGIEPSLVLIIPNLGCTNCGDTKDLDICRDPSLNSQVNSEEGLKPWTCPSCYNAYSLVEIERKLLDMLNKRFVSYQMQDLACAKCKMVKNTLAAVNCDCTGSFVQTRGNLPPEKLQSQNLLNEMSCFKTFVQLLRNFATLHEFKVLTETANNVLSVIS